MGLFLYMIFMYMKHIQFIGYGNMWSAIGRTITQTDTSAHITIDTKTRQWIMDIQRNINADIVFICVKPQQINDIVLDVYNKDATCVSIMNGINTDKLEHFNNIIRTMPNLLWEVHAGVTGRHEKWEIIASTREYIQNIFTSSGALIDIPDEKHFSLFTAFAGCGPAIVAFIEQHCHEETYRWYVYHTLQRVWEELGLDKMQSMLIVDKLRYGVWKYLEKYNITHDQLISKVSSKGWSTEAIIQEFIRLWLGDMITNQTTKIKSTILQGIQAGKIRADQLTTQYSQ